MELSDTVERKFIESFDIDDYEILTDDGWKDCKAIHKTVKYDVWLLSTAHYTLKCADNHIVFDENMNQIFVKDLVIGQKIWTESGLDEVTSVIELDDQDNMYDIELSDDSNHRYYTNGILSHNTTCYTVFCMWLATLFPEKKIMICANKLQTAIEVMDRLRLAYEYLPKWIKPGIVVYNKGEMTFSNKSTIRAFATSSSASRGFSANVVIIDEMAFIPKNIIDEFFASVMPVISSSKNSKAIVVSTPNGTSGLYYEIWQQANSANRTANKEGWMPFRIDWWEVPNRDEDWKQKQIASIGMERWRQEFCNEFLAGTSNHKLIPDDITERYRMKLAEYKLNKLQAGKFMNVNSDDGNKIYTFTMWHEFIPGHAYIASSDIAEGTGGDSSVLYIFDITDLRNITLCAMYDSESTSLIEFAFITTRILKLYNNPFYVCESNGVGAGFLETLRVTYGYQNIVREGKDGKFGINSHVQTKGKACLWLREMFTTEGIGWTLYDRHLIDEFGTFVKKDSKVHLVYNAQLGSHDDHIMALMWAAWILNPEVINTYYIVVDSFTTSLNKILPRRVEPLIEPEQFEIQNIEMDPLHKQFIEFKESICNQLDEYKRRQNMTRNDMQKKKVYSFDELFFGDSSGDEWGSAWVPMDNSQQSVNQVAAKLHAAKLQGFMRPPQFFINSGGGFW